MIKKAINIFFPLLFIAILGNAAPFNQSASWEWPRSTPEEQDLDSQRLNRLVQLIREGKSFPRLESLLIVRNGHLVVEEYFRGFTAEKIHTLQSVSKSFTSALIGIAIERGEIKGVNEKILDFFPNKDSIENLDDRKKAMKLQDLLTMRSGTDYNESSPDSPHFQLNRLAKGWDTFYLNRPMVSQPGTRFLYDSGGVILMSSLLKIRSGMHADKYAEKHLFPALEIKQFRWYKNQEDHPHTGGGLFLTPRDMAKFGQLYLQNGLWQGQQVLPRKWVEESFRMHVRLSGRSLTIGYGYLWWILKPDPDGSGDQNIFAAMGFRAQYIFVIPEHNMVVVVTGSTQSGTDQRKPIAFLYSYILRAVNRF